MRRETATVFWLKFVISDSQYLPIVLLTSSRIPRPHGFAGPAVQDAWYVRLLVGRTPIRSNLHSCFRPTDRHLPSIRHQGGIVIQVWFLYFLVEQHFENGMTAMVQQMCLRWSLCQFLWGESVDNFSRFVVHGTTMWQVWHEFSCGAYERVKVLSVIFFSQE